MINVFTNNIFLYKFYCDSFSNINDTFIKYITITAAVTTATAVKCSEHFLVYCGLPY